MKSKISPGVTTNSKKKYLENDVVNSSFMQSCLQLSMMNVI